MNENRDALKSELFDVVRTGRDSKQLLETQGNLLGRIKKSILEELAMASSPKSVTKKRFLWFTVREEKREGLEHIEALQADLRVILGYEALLGGTINEAETAKMNLEILKSKA